ncbi:MAG TPA: amidohydrolase family protein [Bryobacteraceae bacterium]|nr:amidohydrolase family protein [Bryobacteraceae bacterium]
MAASAQTQRTNVESGRRYARIVIRGGLVVDGSGTPMAGPKDIVIENNTITDVVPLDAVSLSQGRARRPAGDIEIDATGKYVLPGLIDAHVHTQDERGGIPQPQQYELNIWLACGITTVRDVGSDTHKTLELRRKSEAGEIAAPRIFIYPMFGNPKTPELARAHVREIKEMGADGIKFLGINRDIMEAAEDEAHKLGLPIAHHAGVEETNAWDDVKFGTRSIEHWYGIPDAALDGVQHFPADYNYNNEGDRFRYGGHLWREANPEKLQKVLQAMVDAHVAWDPTFSIYEASRDLVRAENQPWFKDYLHPTLQKYFEPNPANHGSYFDHWTSTDEAYWRENYRIWMAAVREFARRGGIVGCGDDAGFIYSMYGFGLIRELELQQEAGFQPLEVIEHATANNARILGQEDHLGKIRAGYRADVIVVNGNPLEDLKVLYPTGVERWVDGKKIHTGGVEWTVKDGIPYRGAALMAEVKDMVTKAREQKGSASSSVR